MLLQCQRCDMGAMMTMFEEEGFRIGDIYSLTAKKKTELIPRHAISFVSAKYESSPVLLVLGILLIILGLLSAYDRDLLFATQRAVGWRGTTGIWGPMLVGALLVGAYFLSRRVGIVVASSGGRLFVETRGRHRSALLGKIYSDLAENQPVTHGHLLSPRRDFEQ